MTGLSPRVRGNLGRAGSAGLRLGSIPAGAGEPHQPLHLLRSSTVYPRGCGGTLSILSIEYSTQGLSPRVRGNPRAARRLPPINRSIPAGAGEPTAGGPVSGRRRVYPRGCGGTEDFKGLKPEEQGLSPRVRGNQPLEGRYQVDVGSIPAGAGEPKTLRASSLKSKVYPRGCGGTSWSFSMRS